MALRLELHPISNRPGDTLNQDEYEQGVNVLKGVKALLEQCTLFRIEVIEDDRRGNNTGYGRGRPKVRSFTDGS